MAPDFVDRVIVAAHGRLRRTRRVRLNTMTSSLRPPLALFLTILMTVMLAAATSQWNGPSGLSGNSQTVSDAFEVPECNRNRCMATLMKGYLEDGYRNLDCEDAPGN